MFGLFKRKKYHTWMIEDIFKEGTFLHELYTCEKCGKTHECRQRNLMGPTCTHLESFNENCIYG